MTNRGSRTRVWAWMRILIVCNAYGPAYVSLRGPSPHCHIRPSWWPLSGFLCHLGHPPGDGGGRAEAAIDAAAAGLPGLPSCHEVVLQCPQGATPYGVALKHQPIDPQWMRMQPTTTKPMQAALPYPCSPQHLVALARARWRGARPQGA